MNGLRNSLPWRALRALRKASTPLRDPIRKALLRRRIQPSARLRDEDLTEKRRRHHVLVDLVHRRCPPRGVLMAEIGVRTGATSAHVLKYCPQIERLVAIDLCALPDKAAALLREPRFEFVQGDSVATAARWADHTFDIVFIDADHSEDAVRRDVAAWRTKVKPGGVLAGHDYGSQNHPGVRIAVDEAFAGHPHPIRTDANRVWWTIV